MQIPQSNYWFWDGLGDFGDNPPYQPCFRWALGRGPRHRCYCRRLPRGLPRCSAVPICWLTGVVIWTGHRWVAFAGCVHYCAMEAHLEVLILRSGTRSRSAVPARKALFLEKSEVDRPGGFTPGAFWAVRCSQSPSSSSGLCSRRVFSLTARDPKPGHFPTEEKGMLLERESAMLLP